MLEWISRKNELQLPIYNLSFGGDSSWRLSANLIFYVKIHDLQIFETLTYSNQFF